MTYGSTSRGDLNFCIPPHPHPHTHHHPPSPHPNPPHHPFHPPPTPSHPYPRPPTPSPTDGAPSLTQWPALPSQRSAGWCSVGRAAPRSWHAPLLVHSLGHRFGSTPAHHAEHSIFKIFCLLPCLSSLWVRFGRQLHTTHSISIL